MNYLGREIPAAVLAMSLAAAIAYVFVTSTARADTPKKEDGPVAVAAATVETKPETPAVTCPVVNGDDYIEAALDVPVAERVYIVRTKHGDVITCHRGERVHAGN